jgi:hypothetical protein
MSHPKLQNLAGAAGAVQMLTGMQATKAAPTARQGPKPPPKTDPSSPKCPPPADPLSPKRARKAVPIVIKPAQLHKRAGSRNFAQCVPVVVSLMALLWAALQMQARTEFCKIGPSDAEINRTWAFVFTLGGSHHAAGEGGAASSSNSAIGHQPPGEHAMAAEGFATSSPPSEPQVS